METSQSQSEPEQEMSFEQKISQDFSRDGRSLSHRQTFGQAEGGSAFPHYRLVTLILGLLNAILLIAAVVIGIYCAKAKDLQISNSAVTPLIIELNYLRNHSDIIRAKLEAQAALAKERTSHLQLKLEVKQKKTVTDRIQGRIEALRTEKANLESNKTAFEESCGRCLPGWILLRSTCYFFSHHTDESRKNWPDSRAYCISKGGDLLVIGNLDEQQLISNNFPKLTSSSVWWEKGFWIGLTDAVTQGTWVWINNVTEVDTMYWRNGQPSHGGPQSGNCVAFYYYSDAMKTWYNGNCNDHLLNWICEMNPKT